MSRKSPQIIKHEIYKIHLGNHIHQGKASTLQNTPKHVCPFTLTKGALQQPRLRTVTGYMFMMEALVLLTHPVVAPLAKETLNMNRTLLTERQKGRALVVAVVTTVTLVTVLQMKAFGGDAEEAREAPAHIFPRPQRTPLSNAEVVEVLMEGPLNATDPRLLEWVRAGAGGRVFKPSTLPYNMTFHNIGYFRDSVVYKFYVDNINKFLISKVGGFFLEAGALDGYLLSTTLMLEKDRAWSGLLVEPRPDMFQELLQKQRKAHAARFCLAEMPFPYKTNFWLSPDYVKESIAYGAVGSKIFEKLPAGQRESGSVVSVHCIPPATLLTALHITHVDLFVLDVEGAEWGVIEHFPFHTITVDMLAVERKDKGKEDREAFIKMIESKGFKLIESLEEDFVFLRKKAVFLVSE